MKKYELRVESDVDFELLERLFTKCSQDMIKCIQNRIEAKQKGNANLEDTTLKNLRGCYERSYFLRSVFADNEIKQKEKYTDYVMRNFRQAIVGIRHACLDQTHFNIVLPFLFFSLVVQNESNKETVARRRRLLIEELKNKNVGDKVSVSKSTWRHQDPFSLYKSEVYENYKSSGSYMRKAKEVEDLFYAKNFDTNNLVSDWAKYLAQSFQFMDKSYPALVACSEYAKIGSFLSDILSVTYNKNNPIDTILALYMIVKPLGIDDKEPKVESKDSQEDDIDNQEGDIEYIEENKYADIIGWCRYIKEDTGDTSIWKYKNEIMTYYLKVSYNDEFLQGKEIHSIYYKNKFSPTELNDQLKKIVVPSKYEDLYKCISKNYHFNVGDILEFFLDKKALSLRVGADELMMDYASCMKKLIRVASEVDKDMSSHTIVKSLRTLFAREVEEKDIELTEFLIARRKEKGEVVESIESLT